MKDRRANWFPDWAANVGCGIVLLSLAAGFAAFIIRACAVQ